jgi:hypothetical protein
MMPVEVFELVKVLILRMILKRHLLASVVITIETLVSRMMLMKIPPIASMTSL